MSLILEALSRSSQERQTDSNSPGLDTPAYVDESELGRPWQFWLPWVILSLALAAVGLLLADKFSDEPASAPTAVESPAEQTVAPVQSQIKAQPAPAVSDGQLKLAEPVKAVEMAEKMLSAVPIAEQVANAEGLDPAVEALYANQPPSIPKQPAPKPANKPVEKVIATPPKRSESNIDIEEVLARTEDALKRARLQEHSAPFIADLSQQLKDDIPTIMYLKHDYSSKPGESVVVLNSKSVRVGGRIGAGMTVEEILTDSVVLNYRGTQFRLRALNSWINL
ncbi:MAG: general secretion pathway protein GspB [Halioglobus sp.]